MKSLIYARALSLVCLAGTLSFMSGCSADMSSLPDTQPSSDFGVVRGAVYGGQQPITAAHVFIFETPVGAGYGDTVPKSLIGENALGTNCTATFPVVKVVANANNGNTTPTCYYQTGGYNGTNGTQNNAVGPGEFQLTGLYTCDVGQNVWLYSISGFPLSTNTDLNPYASIMADLGTCPASGNFSADSFIYMNELSTVAMAYSVAGFTADAVSNTNTGIVTRISAPNSNLAGITNAFNNAQQLYNIFGVTDAGDLSAPPTTTTGARNGTSPYYLINTLGDIMASCINSPGNRNTPSAACTTFFQDIYGNNTTITDTASAMIHIAKNPNALNPSALVALVGTNPVWQPYYTTSTSPKDFSAAITYAGAGSPKGIALDKLGNAFVNNYTNSGYIAKLSPLGAVTTTAALSPAINNAATIAVDSTGFIWAPSVATGELYEVSNSTAFTSVTDGQPAGTFTSPLAPQYADPVMAAGNGGYIYVADYYKNSGEIYKTNASGSTTIITSSTLPGNPGCLQEASGVAVDASGNLWVSGFDATPNIVCRISNDGTAILTLAPKFSGRGGAGIINEADGVAVGLNSSAWVINTGNSNLYNVANSTTTAGTVTGPFIGGGMSGPVAVTVDGNGYVWTANSSTSGVGSISEFNAAGTPVSGSNPDGLGFQSGTMGGSGLLQPSGLAVDISGNVWVANYGNTNVMEIIGIAAPTNALVSQKPATKP